MISKILQDLEASATFNLKASRVIRCSYWLNVVSYQGSNRKQIHQTEGHFPYIDVPLVFPLVNHFNRDLVMVGDLQWFLKWKSG